jgi:hypothetical protein
MGMQMTTTTTTVTTTTITVIRTKQHLCNVWGEHIVRYSRCQVLLRDQRARGSNASVRCHVEADVASGACDVLREHTQRHKSAVTRHSREQQIVQLAGRTSRAPTSIW